MNKHKFSKYALSLTTISLLLLTNSLLFSSPAQGRQARPRLSVIERIKRFFLGTRPGGVAKGRKRGGAVRGPCKRLEKTVIALVPSNENGIPYEELTVSQRPNFWFYIPPLPVNNTNAEFVLMDEDGKDIYAGIFPLQSQPGIINLQLPQNFTSLQANKKYRWIFSAICNPQDRAADVVVNGWLKYAPVNSGLDWKLKLTPANERIFVYTDKLLWYETLTNLAELRQQNPQDAIIQADWAKVLQLMGLPENAANNWQTYALPPDANTTAR